METHYNSRWNIGGVPCRLGAKLQPLCARNQIFRYATRYHLCHLLPLLPDMVSVRRNACLFADEMTDQPIAEPFERPTIKRVYTVVNQHITVLAYQHINRLADGITRLSVCKPTGRFAERLHSRTNGTSASRTVIRSVVRTAGRLADKSMDKQTDG